MNMVTLPVSTIEKVERKLEKALEEVRALKGARAKKAVKPIKFWTKRQWEDAEREADEDIKAGRVKRFDSVEGLIADLNRP